MNLLVSNAVMLPFKVYLDFKVVSVDNSEGCQ